MFWLSQINGPLRNLILLATAPTIRNIMIIQCMSDKSEPQPIESKQSNHRVFETCGLLIVHADCYLKNPAFIGADQGPHSFSGILLWHGSAKLMPHQVITQQGGPGSRSTLTCMLLSSTGSPNWVYMATSAASRPKAMATRPPLRLTCVGSKVYHRFPT